MAPRDPPPATALVSTGEPAASLGIRIARHLRRSTRSILDPSAYSRITSGGAFLPEVDGIRFVAIASVILFHVNTHFKRVSEVSLANGYAGSPLDAFLTHGDTGVEIFFALSGFILALPFCRAYSNAGPKVDVGRYYLRRITRLEPPFLIATAAIFILLLVASYADPADALPHFLATITYSHTLIYGAWSTINPVTWSLETEIQFYVVVPLLAALFVVRDTPGRIALLTSAWLASVVLPAKSDLAPYHLQFSLITYLHIFLVGFLFCELFVNHRHLLADRHRAYDVIGLTALLGIFALGSSSRVVFDLLLLAFLIATFKSVWLNRLLTTRWITTVGGAAYSLYLLHYAVLFVTLSLIGSIELPWFPATLLLQFAIALGVGLVIGMLFFRWCERPFMRPHWPEAFAHSVDQAVARVRPTH